MKLTDKEIDLLNIVVFCEMKSCQENREILQRRGRLTQLNDVERRKLKQAENNYSIFENIYKKLHKLQ